MKFFKKTKLTFPGINLGTIKLLPFILITFFLTECSKQQEPDKPNILWIDCEDISPSWGCYGDSFATTPNIDQLADHGILYNEAYSTAPICSPSRSCLITGLYATSLGTQHLRCVIKKPDFIKTFPNILADAGYFTSNNNKTDYNFDPEGVWQYWKNDMTPWRQRKEGQPFFSMMTFGMTHEGSVNHTEQWENNTKDLPKELFHDPAKTPIPPYYPDSPEIRKIWSHYYDNITVFDRVVGDIVKGLEEDGLLDETIIFVFSDHGTGLPRYKRWLNVTGLKVPFVVYVPEKYKHLIKPHAGSETNNLVSFVDFAPTVLNLAGIQPPETMEGQPFLGKHLPAARREIFGARSRADNMYEMSRAIVTDNYIYVRHYYPQMPYIQSGKIFSDEKESFRELRRLKNLGQLNKEALKMWQKKPVEELYDLKNDPQELNNLAFDSQYRNLMDSLKMQIHQWALKTHDTGFLPEAEYMIRSEGSTPYEMAHDPKKYNLEAIINAAEMVGVASAPELKEKLKDSDSGVRYWAVIGIQALGEKGKDVVTELEKLLDDPSPSVQIAVAETLCRLGKVDKALSVLGKWAKDDRGWLALQAVRSIELIGDEAKPLIPLLYEVLEKNKSTDPNAVRPYKDFNFAAFNTWSAEWALKNMGEEITIY